MTLRLHDGGSTVTFMSNVKCCVPSCGAVRDGNNVKLPYYTFPSDYTLCREWLNVMQLDEEKIGDLSSLHSRLAVCHKHFQNCEGGGLKLCINNETTFSQQINKNSSLDMSKNPLDSVPLKKTLPKVRKVTAGTQTVDNEWVKMFKEELDLDILYGNDIQCRVCARISVQAVNIYNQNNQQSNKAFYIQDLINSLMPIEVKPTDTKPLNICVHCIFKLKEYMILFNHCLKNDRDFDLVNEYIKPKNKKTNPSSQKKNQASEIIHGFILDKDTRNTDAFIFNDKNKVTKDEHLNESKLSKLTSNAYAFIKQETRKHVMKLVLSKKGNSYDESARKKDKKYQCPNEKGIYVKFMAKYIIDRDIERIDEIHISKDELKYSKEIIDQILKLIYDTMKNLSEKNNSKIVPLPILPLHLDSKITPCQQVQTTPIIIDGKEHLNIKIHGGTNESEPLKKTWVCHRCGLKLNNKEYYTTHIKSCYQDRCRFCRQLITPYSKLVEHEEEHRQRADGFICHVCGNQFTTNKSLATHYKQHQNYERLCCKTCNLQLSNGFEFRKHLRQQHKELLGKKNPEEIQKKKQKCSKCSLWLSSKLALRVHMRTHLPIEERKKICQICKKVFINARRFQLHVETHGPCPIKCLECPRSFPSQKHLDNHLYCHRTTEPVYCDMCHQSFKSKTTLKNHISRIHQGIQYVQKKFVCVFCKNVFTSKDELLTHKNMHTLEEKVQAFSGDEHGKIQCNECKKFFLYKSRLSLHKIYHHSSLCQHCGTRTTGSSTNHHCKTKGSNALQFGCQCCSKRFCSKQRFSLHKRTHGLNNRFQCTECSKCFTKLSALKMHSYSHTVIVRNTCNICGKIFKSISTLNTHIEINHQREDLPNNPYNLNNQDLDQIQISLPSLANITKNNDNTSITENVPDLIDEIITLTELDKTLSAVQDLNSCKTHEYPMPIELDLMTPMNLSNATPDADSQNLLCYDISHDIDIPQDITNEKLRSVEILDLQNLYDDFPC